MTFWLLGKHWGIFSHWDFPCGYIISIEENSKEKTRFDVFLGIIKVKQGGFVGMALHFGPFNLTIGFLED
jgi:hypothetical protein